MKKRQPLDLNNIQSLDEDIYSNISEESPATESPATVESTTEPTTTEPTTTEPTATVESTTEPTTTVATPVIITRRNKGHRRNGRQKNKSLTTPVDNKILGAYKNIGINILLGVAILGVGYMILKKIKK